VLNPVVMSKTVKISPLLVLIAVLVGASIGSLVGGVFGGFVAALLAIPTAGALQVVATEIWRATDPNNPENPKSAPAAATTPPDARPPEGAGPQSELFPVPPDAREHDSKQ